MCSPSLHEKHTIETRTDAPSITQGSSDQASKIIRPSNTTCNAFLFSPPRIELVATSPTRRAGHGWGRIPLHDRDDELATALSEQTVGPAHGAKTPAKNLRDRAGNQFGPLLVVKACFNLEFGLQALFGIIESKQDRTRVNLSEDGGSS